MLERTRDDPIYREFADVDLSHWPYVSSSAAVAEMRRLARVHSLEFVFDPGGGEFTAPNFRCRISTNDDCEDLNTLRLALGKRFA